MSCITDVQHRADALVVAVEVDDHVMVLRVIHDIVLGHVELSCDVIPEVWW